VWSSSFSSCGVNQKIEHEPGQLSRAQGQCARTKV
jgi:hypothetical protein